jgi:hypothetical protein
MTIVAFTPSAHRAITGLSLALAVALLSGCGSGGAGSSTGQGPVVIVPVTPTGTAGVGTATSPTPTAKAPAKSDVVGRKFDLGTIVRMEDDGGVQVIIFDRWTALGVADSMLAAKGVPIGVHSDAPYTNVNSKITYRIPVAKGALFTYRHCVAVGQSPQEKPSTLEEFARLKDPEKVIFLTLDQNGRIFSAQNDPAC